MSVFVTWAVYRRLFNNNDKSRCALLLGTNSDELKAFTFQLGSPPFISDALLPFYEISPAQRRKALKLGAIPFGTEFLRYRLQSLINETFSHVKPERKTK